MKAHMQIDYNLPNPAVIIGPVEITDMISISSESLRG
jgi:hypothetical protein